MACRHHAKAVCKSNLLSAITLWSISANTPLCRSTKPLLQGLSAEVFIMRMFIDSASSIKLAFANSPPLSLRNFSGGPKIDNQPFIMLEIISFGSLDRQRTATENLVRWSTICRITFPSKNFRSSPTVSLNLLACGRPTAGLGLGFWKSRQITHSLYTLSILSIRSSSFSPPALSINFRSLCFGGWANCACNFRAIWILSFLCCTIKLILVFSFFRSFST